MRIDYLNIQIEPIHSALAHRKLEIRVRAEGKNYTLVRYVEPDDFESVFDVMFDTMKEEFRRHIKEGRVDGA